MLVEHVATDDALKCFLQRILTDKKIRHEVNQQQLPRRQTAILLYNYCADKQQRSKNDKQQCAFTATMLMVVVMFVLVMLMLMMMLVTMPTTAVVGMIIVFLFHFYLYFKTCLLIFFEHCKGMALNVQLGCKNKQANFVLRLICSNFALKTTRMSTNNKIVYRAIALDLDGTLTNNKKEITPATRKALLTAQENGAHIILASGRPTFGIEPVAESLELSTRGGYILSYNGGKIIDWRTKEEIYSQHLPNNMIPTLYNYAKEHGYALLGYVGKEIITESADDIYVAEESRINKMPIRKVDNLLANLEPNPTKLLMTAEPTVAAKAEQELLALVGDRMDVYRSAPFFVELVPKGIDKAQSLLRLLAKLNLTPQDMIAFGDGYNDLSMLRLAGMGVAMSNAAPEVRSEANYVTLSNEEDGVAVAINKLCYNND